MKTISAPAAHDILATADPMTIFAIVACLGAARLVWNAIS